VLLHAIADQVLFLRDVLGHRHCNRTTAPMTTATTMAELETFTINLHLFAKTRHQLLMLSRLSGWTDWLRGFLSFVLSLHLGGGNAAPSPPPGMALTSATFHDCRNHDHRHPRGDDSRKDAYQPTHHFLQACDLEQKGRLQSLKGLTSP
jgi:hypothetical protein